jgi:hypothetical protein
MRLKWKGLRGSRSRASRRISATKWMLVSLDSDIPVLNMAKGVGAR